MKVLGIVTLSCVLVRSHAARCPAERRRLRRPEPWCMPAAGGIALHWAVVGARRRLEQPACRGLFSEYSDASGRTLQENLDALGETGGSLPRPDPLRRRQRPAALQRGRRVRVHDAGKPRGLRLRPRVQGPGQTRVRRGPRPSSSTRRCTPWASARTRRAPRRSPPPSWRGVGRDGGPPSAEALHQHDVAAARARLAVKDRPLVTGDGKPTLPPYAAVSPARQSVSPGASRDRRARWLDAASPPD